MESYEFSKTLAGFECGILPHIDLVSANLHTPKTDMELHYDIVKAHGINVARDGLPFKYHNQMINRIFIAYVKQVEVIWDLMHFDPIDNIDAIFHAEKVVSSVLMGVPTWFCPVNEPSYTPNMCSGVDINWAIARYNFFRRFIEDKGVEARFMTVDPITGAGDHEYEATDQLVHNGRVDVVGINYYPHAKVENCFDVIMRTWNRYKKPVMISETSWHVGHVEQAEKNPWCRSRAQWFNYIATSIEAAKTCGAEVHGLCWYPIIDSPDWNDQTKGRWWNGLISENNTTDLLLSEAIKAYNAQGYDQ